MSRYLAVNRLEFAVTYSCTGKCRHCYSTPKGQKFLGRISKSLAVEIVKEVGEKYGLESVMTFGGEPLLFPEIVFAIHRTAADLGIPVRNVITNGYWSNDPQKIKEIAMKLKKAGVNSIDISVDAFHQEYIPLEIVRKAAEACLKVGIEYISWNPCWVISKEHDNPYNRKTRLILKQLEHLPIKDSGGNIMEPSGLALINLKEYLPPKKKMPEGNCGEMPYTNRLDSIKFILIEPNGEVSICNDLYIGNAAKTNIIELLENYDPYKIQELKALVENGIKGLVEWARKKDIELDPDGYYNICHMCTSIRGQINQKSKHNSH